MDLLEIPVGKPVEAPDLLKAMHALIPDVDVLDLSGSFVIVRRSRGVFTSAEAQTLRDAVALHDAAAIRQAQEAKRAQQATERAKDPKTLSDKERLLRLEIILGID